MTLHEYQARLNYATGYSCEQAVFAAFASDMGLSMVGALQRAPRHVMRGSSGGLGGHETCGAYRSGVAVLEAIGANRATRSGEDAVIEFRRLFEEQFGSVECGRIRMGRKDCLDVIGMTVRILERVTVGNAEN